MDPEIVERRLAEMREVQAQFWRDLRSSPEAYGRWFRRNMTKRAINVPPDGNWCSVTSGGVTPEDQPPPPAD